MTARVQQLSSSKMSTREWALLICLSVLWGASFFFNGVAVHELPSLTLVWLRVAIAATTLQLVLVVRGQRLPSECRVIAAFAVMGLLNNVLPFTLIVWGQHRVASGLAAILNAMTPLFTTVVAHLFTADEKLTPEKMVGVMGGICGVIVMFGPMALMGIGTETLAELACLGAALSYAFAGVFGRRFRRLGVTPLATATGQVTASAVMLFPIIMIFDRPWELTPPHVATWGAVLGIGVLSTAVAYVLYFKILEAAGATNLLLVTFLIPVTAILLGTYVLREHLLLRHLVGMGLIGTGLAVIDGRLLLLVNRRLNAFAMLRMGFRSK